jgi:ubiquinone/menaquinone biosynthesis C-methylase UbiE
MHGPVSMIGVQGLGRDQAPGDLEMRAYYAARAPQYDAVYRKAERQADLRRIEAWLPARFAGRDLLEIACGTGYWTRWLAGSARSILAIDAAAETLAIARERVGGSRIRFELGDAYALDRWAGRCDAAFAGFWFSHVPRSRRVAFLKALCAVLRPGAPVVLLDNRYVPGSSTPVSEIDAEGDCWQSRRLVDGSWHRVLKNFPSAAELDSLLAGLGLAGAWVQWDHYWAYAFRTPSAPAAGSCP